MVTKYHFYLKRKKSSIVCSNIKCIDFFFKKTEKIHSGRTEELGGAAPAAKVAHVDGKISETRETTSDRATPMAPRKTLEFHLDFVRKKSLNRNRDTSLPLFYTSAKRESKVVFSNIII